MELFRAEEEDLVEVAVRLSTTTTDSWGTLSEIAKILHTCHVNTVDSLTIP